MKPSRFLVDISLPQENGLLYSTFTRKYYAYDFQKRDNLHKLIGSLNRDKYSVDDANLLLELYKRGLIVDDSIDELEVLKYLENKACYQNNSVRLSVFLTNNCNFKCSYCEQVHINSDISDSVTECIIKWVEKICHSIRKIDIIWFGGEPLLQYDVMKKIILDVREICTNNGCSLKNHIATNGYLLTHERLEEMKNLQFGSIQITVDGNKENHNKNRHLINGAGTYDIVIKNIIKAAALGHFIVLRMNVNASSINLFKETLDLISPEVRYNIYVSVANIFQEENKISAFQLKKYAINNGYRYGERNNNYYGCLSCGHNSIVVNTNGKVLFCTHEDNEEIGILHTNGVIRYKNQNKHHQAVMKTLLENAECRNCVELPLCLGGCNKARQEQNEKCLGKRPDGLSVEEIALLDYYYDERKNKLKTS